MEITPATLVADVMIRRPASASVFERHRIDPGANSHRPLSDVCRERRLTFESLLTEIESAAAPKKEDARYRTTAPLTDVIDHVDRQYHARLEADLPRIALLCRAALEAHSARQPEIEELDRVFGLLRNAIAEHSQKEDRVVFPLIRWLENGDGASAGRPPVKTLKEMMRLLTHEHNTILATLLQLHKTALSLTPALGASEDLRALQRELSELEAGLHAHMRIEDTILFPRALELERRLQAPESRATRAGRPARRAQRNRQ